MSPFAWLSVLSLVPATIVGALVFQRVLREGCARRESLYFGVIVGVLAELFVTFAAINVFLSQVPYNTVVLDGKGSRIAEFPVGGNLWRWDRRLQGKQFDFSERQIEVSMRVSPITDNPKVRRIVYNVRVEILGSAQAVEKFYRYAYRIEQWRADGDWLASRLYEFNEQASRDLAKFYNPKDPKQQQAFQDLLRPYIEEDLLKADARFVGASFDIE